MSLRSATIRLAHSNANLRLALLPILREAKEFPSSQALGKYLQEHPKAVREDHWVRDPKQEAEDRDWGAETPDKKKKDLSDEEKAEIAKDKKEQEKRKKEKADKKKDEEGPSAEDFDTPLQKIVRDFGGMAKLPAVAWSALKAAPKEVLKMWHDPAHLEDVQKKAVIKLKESPKETSHHVWHGVKHTGDMYLQAGSGALKLASPHFGDLSADEHKALFKVGVQAAQVAAGGLAGAALGPAGAAAGAGGALLSNLIKHVASTAATSAIHSSIGHLSLMAEATEGLEAGHHLLELLKLGAKKGDKKEDVALHQFTDVVTAEVAKILSKKLPKEMMEAALRGEEPKEPDFKDMPKKKDSGKKDAPKKKASLRDATIRLAHMHPHLRAHLLPVLARLDTPAELRNILVILSDAIQKRQDELDYMEKHWADHMSVPRDAVQYLFDGKERNLAWYQAERERVLKDLKEWGE